MTLPCRAAIFMAAFILSFPTLSQDLPRWIFSAEELPGKLSAVGNGKTLQSAKHAALAEILAQVSQTTSTQTESVLRKEQNETSTFFQQAITSRSLSLDLNGLNLEEQFKDLSSGTTYVLVSVSKSEIVRFLNDELKPLDKLLFPNDASPAEQLLWSLKFKTSCEYGVRLERALSALGSGKLSLRKELKSCLSQIVTIWQKSGIRIIADNSLDPIVAVVNKHFPSSTHTALWLQLQPQRKTRKNQGVYEEKFTLLTQLTQPHSPFSSYYSKELSVIGKGSSASQASSNAEAQMREILKQPLQNWLFEKGSNL